MSSCTLPKKPETAVCVEKSHTTPSIEQGYLNTNGVMEYLSISRYTLRDWRNKFILPFPLRYCGRSPIWSVDQIKLSVFIKTGRRWNEDTYDALLAVRHILNTILYSLDVNSLVVAEGFNRDEVMKDAIRLYDRVIGKSLSEERMVLSVYYILVKLKLIVKTLSHSSMLDSLQYYIKKAETKLLKAGE